MFNLRFRYRWRSMKGTEGIDKSEGRKKNKGTGRTIKYPLEPG